MEKLVVGPSSKHAVSLDASVSDNLGRHRGVPGAARQGSGRGRARPSSARAADRGIREAGARIQLIGDGDLSAGISAAVRGSGVHASSGPGAHQKGVLVAAAMRCLNGEILARLVVDTTEKDERCRSMGITDMNRVYRSADLACGKKIIFAATGVTDGTLMKGVRFFGEGTRTSSLVMQTDPHRIQFHRQHTSTPWRRRQDSLLGRG